MRLAKAERKSVPTKRDEAPPPQDAIENETSLELHATENPAARRPYSTFHV